MSYTIVATHKPKGAFVVRCPSQDGYKTRAARLAVALKGRWTHRNRGYTMSHAKAIKFERLYFQGWDATIMGNLLKPEEA